MHQLLRILARAAVIVVIASLFPAKLHASDLWLDARYAKPLRWNVGAFLFFDQDDVQNRNGGRRIIVGGNVGPNGMQAWGGKPLDLPGGGSNGALDLRAVITRTWDNPRGASPNSTYAGGEVGWVRTGRVLGSLAAERGLRQACQRAFAGRWAYPHVGRRVRDPRLLVNHQRNSPTPLLNPSSAVS